MATRAWVPTDLGTTNCRLWASVKNLGSMSLSGSDVVQINDLSGNARHLKSDVGNRPVYDASGFGSIPTLSFVGSKYLYSASNLGSAIDSLGCIVLATLDTATAADFGVAASCASSSNSYSEPGSALFVERNGGTTIDAYRADVPYAATSVTNQVPFIKYTYWTTANTVLWGLNGTGGSSAYTTVAFSSDLTPFLGYERFAAGDTGAYWKSEISEVIYFSSITTDEVAKLEGYLHWEYGLQGNLPGGHPYKSAAPTVTIDESEPPELNASGLIANYFIQPLCQPFSDFLS